MASATVSYTPPKPPEVDTVTLALSSEEATALLSVLATVAVVGVGRTTYNVFIALQDAGIKHEDLTPSVKDSRFPLVRFTGRV